MKNHITAKGHITIKDNDTTKNHATSSTSLEQKKPPNGLKPPKPPEPPGNLNELSEEPPEQQYLSKYGFMRESYLKDHQPKTYKRMIQSGELKSHCLEVQQQAKNRLDFMMEQMVEHNPSPSRNDDGLAWAAHMNMLKHRVEEVIFDELIYV